MADFSLIDTHTHLDFPQFDADRDDLLKKLAAEQIAILAISTSKESVTEVVKLANSNSLVWGLIGLHPTDVSKRSLVELPGLLDEWSEIIAKNPKIVGIGEIGLDYYHDREKETANRQKSALRQMLTFAQEKNLPISFHCRDAYGDLLTILQDYEGIRGVVHCYYGSADQAKRFLELGLYLSFTAMITYPTNESLREVVAKTPLERILLETDCPFLPPQERRGGRNDPFTIHQIAELIAQIKGVEVAKVHQQTTANATKLFGLGDSGVQ